LVKVVWSCVHKGFAVEIEINYFSSLTNYFTGQATSCLKLLLIYLDVNMPTYKVLFFIYLLYIYYFSPSLPLFLSPSSSLLLPLLSLLSLTLTLSLACSLSLSLACSLSLSLLLALLNAPSIFVFSTLLLQLFIFPFSICLFCYCFIVLSSCHIIVLSYYHFISLLVYQFIILSFSSFYHFSDTHHVILCICINFCAFQHCVNIKFVIVKLRPITTKEGEVVDIFLNKKQEEGEGRGIITE
jgi:hypothetical protein